MTIRPDFSGYVTQLAELTPHNFTKPVNKNQKTVSQVDYFLPNFQIVSNYILDKNWWKAF